MKRFLHKKLPAFLLALTLMVSMIPMAGAVGDCAAVGKDHEWNDWQTTQEPTCTADGVKERTCKNCSAKETDSVSALGHDFSGAGEVSKAPT
mgnify:CR=1 FL=1